MATDWLGQEQPDMDAVPSPQQVAWDDGRSGREMWMHYYNSGDESLLSAFQAGSKEFDKKGPNWGLQYELGQILGGG